MDSIIKNSVKKEIALDDRVKASVEAAVSALNLDEILQNPQAVLELFVEELKEKMVKKYTNEYVLEGVLFADAVKKSKAELDLTHPIEGLDKVME